VDIDCSDSWIDGGWYIYDPDATEGAESNSPTGDAVCQGATQ
jgi:hypothetical protein